MVRTATTDMTETPTLTGTLYGATRAELLTAAAGRAAEYFGTACVAVRLENERPHGTLSGFNAEFRAREHHEVEVPTYGPGKCRGCDRSSWPQDPLPRARWK